MLLSGFRGVALKNYFSSILNFGQIPQFKRGITPRIKMKSNVYLHNMSFITTKFHEIKLRGFRGVVLTNCFSSIFHFGQIF